MYSKTKMESEETKWLKKRYRPVPTEGEVQNNKKINFEHTWKGVSSIPIQKSKQLPSITGYYHSISEYIQSPEYTQ